MSQAPGTARDHSRADGRPAPRAQRGGVWRRRPARPATGIAVVYDAIPTAASRARRDVARIAEQAGACPDQVDDIKLAVTEACTNAVLHAFRRDGGRSERFAVSTRVDRGVFTVWVADDGGGQQDSASDGLGMGLFLIAELTQGLQIGALPDGRTQLMMRFVLRPDAPVGAPG